MKALVVKQFGELGALVVEERPAPVPGTGEVLVDVRAAGVNFPDLMVIAGTYQHLPPLPFIPGKECAGVVTAIGPCVTLVKPGDRVMVQIEYGAFAGQIVAKQMNCHAIPDALSFTEAAAIGLSYMTAYFALVERAQLKPGETVLVTGAAGGVGLAAVQIAKALGALVIAAVDSPEKAAVARANGAGHVIDTTVADLRNALREEVLAVTAKRGADVILDQVGGDVFDACLRAIAWCGRMVVIGFASGRIPDIKAGYILVKNIAVIGLQVSDYRDRQPEKFRAMGQQLFELYSTGKIKPHVMATYALEDAALALKAVQNGKVIGKVVLTMA